MTVASLAVQAACLLQGLLEQCPGYIDSYLRLSAIANLRGNFREAAEWLDRGLDAPGQQDNPDLLCAAGAGPPAVRQDTAGLVV